MTLQEMIYILRSIRDKEIKGGWVPSAEPIYDVTRGSDGIFCGPTYPVGNLLLEAYLSHTFDHQYFNDLRSSLIGAGDSEAVKKTVLFLHAKGFDVGIRHAKVGIDCVERIARSFEEVGREIGSSSTIVHPKKDDLSTSPLTLPDIWKQYPTLPRLARDRVIAALKYAVESNPTLGGKTRGNGKRSHNTYDAQLVRNVVEKEQRKHREPSP